MSTIKKPKKLIAIWKPKGPTSFNIVAQVRKITGEKRVGHAGTLDPLAQGILVIAITREATRKISEIVQKEKEYEATIKLGENSTTEDEEGKKTIVKFETKPNLKNIQEVLKKFQGLILQKPPIFSAIKIHGQTAYSLARKGEIPEMKLRSVEIKKIKLQSYRWPYLKIKVLTGPGVYIRSLARDIGFELETGGYLSNLIRTRVGQFTKSKAYTISQLRKVRY